MVAVGAGAYDERVTIPVGAGGTAARPTRFIAGGAVVVKRGFVVNADYTSLTGFEVTPIFFPMTRSPSASRRSRNRNEM